MTNVLNDCGCCEGLTAQTPAKVENRPGLSAIAYRVGTHAQFKQSMLAALSKSDYAALNDLTTRGDDDFSIALLDAAATMADVLTFYQERIANESYLRTATERRSLLELARLIGYEPSPGVAANTWLAFTLDDTPGAPEEITIDAGVKVQSVPGPGEQPQIFETVETIKARPAWNAMKPALTQPQTLSWKMTQVYLKGTTLGLKPGDSLLFADRKGKVWQMRRIRSATPEPASGSTQVVLDEASEGQPIPDSIVDLLPEAISIHAFRQQAALFGHNAPDWRAMPESVKAGYRIAQGLYAEYFQDVGDGASRQFFVTRKTSRVDPTVDFNWGGGSPHPDIFAGKFSARWKGWVKPAISGKYQFCTDSDDGVRLWVDGKLIINNWTDHWKTTDQGSLQLQEGRLYPILLEYYEATGDAVIRLSWVLPGETSATVIPSSQLYPDIPDEWPGFTIKAIADGKENCLHLDALYPQILPQSWLVLSTPDQQELYYVTEAIEAARSGFTLSAKTTRVTLKGKNLQRFDNAVRNTVVFAQSEPLTGPDGLPASPISESKLVKGTTDIRLDSEIRGLIPGMMLCVSGTDVEGRPMVEVLELQEARLDDAMCTELRLKSGLAYSYERATVTINANVAKATHGETKQEVLGSGDASQPYQRFTLRQRPLTYITSGTTSGAESTLKVYVNDVLWHEVPAFYGHGPKERIYVTQRDDDGRTVIQFGDGITGARLPTGQENVRAVYRSGIGLDGNLKAGQLTLLMSRPLGVRSVTNPLPANDGADAEAPEDIRRNAPLKVMTLERAVSLRDYEDFARAYPGIAKACATWAWDGRQRCIFLTVAGPKGEPVSDGRKKELLDALRKAGDPYVCVKVQDYRKVPFGLVAKLKVDPDRLPEKVLAEVRQALCNAFSFEARSFGQPLTRSEVIAVIHAVPGVVAVVVDQPTPVKEATVLSPALSAILRDFSKTQFTNPFLVGIFAGSVPPPTQPGLTTDGAILAANIAAASPSVVKPGALAAMSTVPTLAISPALLAAMTAAIRDLQTTCDILGTELHVLDPKSVTLTEM